MKDKHPFDPYVLPNSEKLIIGTIPPHRFCVEKNKELSSDDVNFYYGSRDNYFWELIGEIFNINFSFENNDESILQRKDFLKDNKIGITDIIQECYRKNNGSSDDDLNEIDYKPIDELLKGFPAITQLIYTSEFVKKCVNDKFKTYHEIDKNNKKIQYVSINGTKYKVHILYSPSPNALRNMGKNGKEKRKKQYENVFIQC